MNGLTSPIRSRAHSATPSCPTPFHRGRNGRKIIGSEPWIISESSVVSALATHTFYIQMGFLAAGNRQRPPAAMALRWI
jgi:hypothetical protein